jgi:hypothetical protein
MSGPSKVYLAMVKERDSRPSALVRGDDGYLHLRQFVSAVDANLASHHLNFVTPDAYEPAPSCRRRSRGRLRLAEAAREIGVCAKTFKKYLTHIRHERPSPNVTLIPREEMDLLKIHGLHGLARLRLSSLL